MRRLWVGDTNITDAGLAAIRNLTNALEPFRKNNRSQKIDWLAVIDGLREVVEELFDVYFFPRISALVKRNG